MTTPLRLQGSQAEADASEQDNPPNEQAGEQADGEPSEAGSTEGDPATFQEKAGIDPEDNPISGNVEAADDTRIAISHQSETAGEAVNWLDSMALQVGGLRISIWDCAFVISVIFLTIVFAKIANHMVHNVLRRSQRLDPSQQLLAEKLLSIVIWTVAVLVGLDLLGIDLTALAIFSGAFGLAIGFGLQKTIGNFIAGIILLMDKSIKPGDIIAVADQSGQSTFGQIRKIGIRAVSITTRDQIEYLIPNENLMVNQVENWSYSSKRVRIQVPVGISYSCDIKQAEKLMMEAAKSAKRVLKDPAPNVWLHQYGDSSVDFIIHCWISDPENGIGNVRSAILKELWVLFEKNEIEIPFPQRDLNLRSTPQVEQLIAAISQRMDERKQS